MRLFWLLMSKAYPGLFNGSERLNALELTKRMAWIYGDVADSVGIPVQQTIRRISIHRRLFEQVQIDHVERFIYDRFMRFPNLSSIAAARFIHDNPSLSQAYYTQLENAVSDHEQFGNRMARTLQRLVRYHPSHIPKTDRHILPTQDRRRYLNGVMFSPKWLTEDLGLDRDQAKVLRDLVDQSHRDHGMKEGSPADWWAIVLADGDGMGRYISGDALKNYCDYIPASAVDQTAESFNAGTFDNLLNTKKRMGPATHIGLNRALLDFSNRLVPYITEKRFCGKVIYSGGDDVMAVLPLEDLPEYLQSLQAAWSGDQDPYADQDPVCKFGVVHLQAAAGSSRTGYWYPTFKGETVAEQQDNRDQSGLPNRPLFTMGKTATMSMGVVIAHKSVPLPTVLEKLWEAEGDLAKEMHEKDGICFRVIYGGGNTLEALMKGHLLNSWWKVAQHYADELSPVLYRLADELPKRVDINHPNLFPLATQVILNRREEGRRMENIEAPIMSLIRQWALWAYDAHQADPDKPGARSSDDLGYLLRFTAFWVDRMVQRQKWQQPSQADAPPDTILVGRTN
jgi:CRISPR-associated protein Cmr2